MLGFGSRWSAGGGWLGVFLLVAAGSACNQRLASTVEEGSTDTTTHTCAMYEEPCEAEACCPGLACVDHPSGARCEPAGEPACGGRGESCSDDCCPGLSCYSDPDETWYCDDADACNELGSSCDGDASQFPCCGSAVCVQGECQETACADWHEPCGILDCCDGLTCVGSSEEEWFCESAETCIPLGHDCDIERWPCCDGSECNGYTCQVAGCMGVRETCTDDDCCEGLVCDHGPAGPGGFGSCQPEDWCTPLGNRCDDDTPQCCSGGDCIDGTCEFLGDTDTDGDDDTDGPADTTD